MDRAEITKRIKEFQLQDMLKARRPKVRLLKQSPEERAASLAELERFEAARLAKMTPTEQDSYKAEMQKRENARRILSERTTLTNLDIEALKLQREDEAELRERAEVEREAVELARVDATSSQGGTDRALTKALEKIKVLERTPEERLERMIKQYPTHEQELRRFFKRWGVVPAYFNPYGGPHEDPDDLQSIELEYAEQEIADIGQERDNARQTSKSAASAQGGTDRKLTEARRRIAELEAKLAATEAARVAALKARDEMLKLYTDQHGK